MTREEQELRSLRLLARVWEELRSSILDAAPGEYRKLLARAQKLYGQTWHLVPQPYWESGGRSVNAFQQVLGQSDLQVAQYDPFWLQNWGGCSSAIQQAVGRQKERIAQLKERASTVRPTEASRPPPAKVFIVHGHDRTVLAEVARFLGKLDIESIILMEQPHGGRTLMEKLERNSDVAYAVVLCTADDFGRAEDEQELQQRPRQNVILELGYFIGSLGRGNLCVLREEGLDMPSDFHGVGYHVLDATGAWQLSLAREMKAAGLPVDLNKLG
jgi:predicted nucleotide-binding protein